MNKNTHSQQLLSILKKLYSQLTMAIAHIRLHSYHFSFESKKNFDIISVLNKQVDELAAHATNTYSQKFIEKQQQSDRDVGKNMIGNQQENKIKNISGMESEFSKHLKQKKSSSVSLPHMGGKLKASAWEHIHSAIRYAKQGKVDTAKLHTDIAGHALEEAGHYLTKKEYSDLVNQVEQYFANQKK